MNVMFSGIIFHFVFNIHLFPNHSFLEHATHHITCYSSHNMLRIT